MTILKIILSIWAILAIFNCVILMISSIRNPEDLKDESTGMILAVYIFSCVLSPVVFGCIVFSFIRRFVWGIIGK
jgi:hypothetical protein